MSYNKGLFIAVDGPNGSGKSNIVNFLNVNLQSLGYDVVVTKEPMDNTVRDLEKTHRGLNYAQIIADDRRTHIEKIIKPALANRKMVVCDRYIASSLALQGLDGIDLGTIWNLHSHFIIKPDIYIFLSVSERKLKSRMEKRRMLSRFEREYSCADEQIFFKRAEEFLSKKNFNTVNYENEYKKDCNIIVEGVQEQIRQIIT